MSKSREREIVERMPQTSTFLESEAYRHEAEGKPRLAKAFRNAARIKREIEDAGYAIKPIEDEDDGVR